MGYLTPRDYKKTIQRDNLNQVIADDPQILSDAEGTAIEKASTLLVQKYIIGREFAGTPAWDKTKAYNVFQRVYLDAPVYSTGTTYVTGDYVSYLVTGEKNYRIYKSIAGNAPGAFNQAQWTFVNYQYSIYNAGAPKPEFNYLTAYNAGDQVYWNGKVYTAVRSSPGNTQADALQYGTYSAVPLGNIFPDDPVNGVQYWGAGVAYNIAANTDILDAKWIDGDNRSALLVWAIVALTLYYVHARIAPNNVPDLRVKDYNDAIAMMKKDFANGEATAINLQPIQPRTGGRIRWGGNVKNQNSY